MSSDPPGFGITRDACALLDNYTAHVYLTQAGVRGILPRPPATDVRLRQLVFRLQHVWAGEICTAETPGCFNAALLWTRDVVLSCLFVKQRLCWLLTCVHQVVDDSRALANHCRSLLQAANLPSTVYQSAHRADRCRTGEFTKAETQAILYPKKGQPLPPLLQFCQLLQKYPEECPDYHRYFQQKLYVLLGLTTYIEELCPPAAVYATVLTIPIHGELWYLTTDMDELWLQGPFGWDRLSSGALRAKWYLAQASQRANLHGGITVRNQVTLRCSRALYYYQRPLCGHPLWIFLEAMLKQPSPAFTVTPGVARRIRTIT